MRNMTKRKILITLIAAVLVIALSVAAVLIIGKVKEKREYEELLSALRE